MVLHLYYDTILATGINPGLNPETRRCDRFVPAVIWTGCEPFEPPPGTCRSCWRPSNHPCHKAYWEALRDSLETSLRPELSPSKGLFQVIPDPPPPWLDDAATLLQRYHNPQQWRTEGGINYYYPDLSGR